MPTAAELTDPHRSTYTWVLPAGPGVCEICHEAPNAGYERCFSCSQAKQVSRPTARVVPISLVAMGVQMHDVLRHYKDNRSEVVRRDFDLQIRRIGKELKSSSGRLVRRTAFKWETPISYNLVTCRYRRTATTSRVFGAILSRSLLTWMGKPCHPWSRGLLNPRHVRAAAIVRLGKESTRLTTGGPIETWNPGLQGAGKMRGMR